MRRTPTTRAAVRAVAVTASIGTVALLGACGSSGGAGADQPASIEEALGLDEDAIQEREAKVQEEVRKCMEAEGFDYVPMDPSRLNLRIVGPGQEDSAEFRRTQGYGITTMFGKGSALADGAALDGGGSDPNREIREALSEEDRKAYDRALFGSAAVAEGGESGGFSVMIGPGPGEVDAAAEAPDPSEMGCFGQAQEKVGDRGRIERFGPKLQELQERIASDPRMVRADGAWAECMSGAGFDFETPDDIPPFLFGRLQELQEALGGGGGPAVGGGDGAVVIGRASGEEMEALANSPELAALQREELALARADDDCSESTGRRETAEKVRTEAERRFLEENPDFGAGDGEG